MDQHQFLSKYLLEWPKKEQLEAFIQKEQAVETNKSDVGMSNNELNFGSLVSVIEQTHQHFQQQAVKAVNVSLTKRNYLIGLYIAEFEQKGEDRAAYGTRLVDSLAESINIRGLGNRNLKLFRQFYFAYTKLGLAFDQYLDFPNQVIFKIVQLATAQLQDNENESVVIIQRVSELLKQNSDSSKSDNNYRQILERISFTHLSELLKIEDNTKRTFYELLVLKTTPSVKQLKHQINTLVFERVGLSSNTETAIKQLQSKIEPENASDAIKSIYTFDFLGLKSDGMIEEKDLETALLDHLQEFMLEMGHGFCFEYRQKRILIDDEYFFVDLVFYHRILKCHVIVELKIDAFKQEHMGQLNTYVAFYNAEVKREDDNPAIGILLCTEKGKKLVEYATAGMDQQLFVSKYLLELPKKEQLEAFIQKELEKLK
jgi:predicted nuclease of restriction endonuclease-like (RecB) superfamily